MAWLAGGKKPSPPTPYRELRRLLLGDKGEAAPALAPGERLPRKMNVRPPGSGAASLKAGRVVCTLGVRQVAHTHRGRTRGRGDAGSSQARSRRRGAELSNCCCAACPGVCARRTRP